MYFFDISKYAAESVPLLRHVLYRGQSIRDIDIKRSMYRYAVYDVKSFINSNRVLYLRENGIISDTSIDLNADVAEIYEDILYYTSYNREVMNILSPLFTEQTWDIWLTEEQNGGIMVVNSGDYRAAMFEKHVRGRLW